LAAAAVAATALALLGANLWVGIKTEERLRAALAAQNAEAPVRVHLLDYQRGLFAAQMISEIEIALPARLTGGDSDRRWLRLPVPVRHEIKHGPLIIGRLPGQKWRREPLLIAVHSVLDPRSLGAGGEQWQLTADTLVTLQGDIVITFALAPLDPAAQKRIGLSGRMKINRKPARMNGELQILDLAWRQGERDCRVRDLHLAITAREEENGLLSGELTGRLAELITGGQPYGPGELAAAWRNLPRSAGSRLLSLAPRAGEEISGRTAQTLVETLPEFIQNNAEITMEKLRLATPEGQVAGSLRLAFKGREERVLFHPLALLSALRLELALEIPESMAPAATEDQRQLLEALVERGYLRRQEGQLRLNMSYQEGSLILNNNPLPWQELLYSYKTIGNTLR